METKWSLHAMEKTNDQSEERSMWQSSVTTSPVRPSRQSNVQTWRAVDLEVSELLLLFHNPSLVYIIDLGWNSGPLTFLNGSSAKARPTWNAWLQLARNSFQILQIMPWMESTADPYTTQIHSRSELGVRQCQAMFHGLAVIMENGSRAVLEHFLKPRFIIKLIEEINLRLTKYCLFTPYFVLYRLTDN